MGAKLLDVPLFLQPQNTPYCGPACVRMVLAFHGSKTALGKIVSSLNVSAWGVDMATLGGFFLERGFEVTIDMWLPRFPNRFIGLTHGVERELLRWCRRRVGAKGRDRDLIYRETIPRFIEQGGVVRPKPVSLQSLQEAIKQDCPPILNLNVAIMHQYQRLKDAGHYVVPRQVTKSTITVNDPNGFDGGIKTYPTELVLHACYSWLAGAMFIEPKSKAAR